MISINFISNKFIPNKLYNYLLEILKNIGQKENTNNPDFGHYTNAKLLGFGFHNSYTNKLYLHHIFKGQQFYPKTMVIKKTWVSKNQKLVSDFMNNQTLVVKPNKGFQGRKVQLTNSISDLISKIDDKEFWVLQKIIKPKLFNNRKFDLRVFHIIFKYKNNYYNILTKVGFAKVSVYDYQSNNQQGFVTNISFNNKIKTDMKFMYEFFDFMTQLEKDDKQRKKLIKGVYKLIREYSKLLVKKIQQDNKFKNQPLSQMIIYGPDIIFDKNDNAQLIETNSYPGLLIDGEVITPIQKVLFKDLMKKVFIPILQNKEIKPEVIQGDLFSIEKI